jgi:hypothetical protein
MTMFLDCKHGGERVADSFVEMKKLTPIEYRSQLAA